MIRDPEAELAAHLDALDRLNPMLNAVVAADREGAQAAAARSAERWRKGAPLSPIDGMVVGAKANFAIEGLPWTAAIAAHRHRVAQADSAAVAHLRAAGAIVLGVLNMHEGALGATTTSPLYGRCYNPLKEGYTPGGSSGGSGAAVAAGIVAGALGSDTMGSTRVPSAYTGTCGFKPSFGRISRAGMELLSPSFDHVGLHARTPADLARLYAATAGFDAADPASVPAFPEARPPRRFRFGRLVFKDEVQAAPGIVSAFEAALDRIAAAGAEIISIRLDGYAYAKMRRRGLLVVEAEGAAALAGAREADPAGVSSEFGAMLDYGARQPALRLAAAFDALRQTVVIARAAFAQCDALLAPTTPQVAFPHTQTAPDNQADLTAFANFAGLPAIALPIGMAEEGLPASLQILTSHGADETALAAAAFCFAAVRG